MIALIKYIDFHYDNYQGGSGTTIESSFTWNVPDRMTCDNFYEQMHERLLQHLVSKRPFANIKDTKYTVKSIEIL